MKINFKYIDICFWPNYVLEDHYNHLIKTNPSEIFSTGVNFSYKRSPPNKYADHYCIDVVGPELIWINENFPKEKYKWYLWFESVFIVPEEMYTILMLKYK